MARATVQVDKSELQRAVDQVEANETFPNMSRLYDAVANTDWAKNHQPKPLNSSVIMLRIKDHKITYKTVKGKKGGSGDALRAARAAGTINRVSKANKFAANEAIQHSLKAINYGWGNSHEGWREKLEKGSRSAALAMKCLDCVGGQTSEVARCTSYGCALWPFRQWQGRSELELRINGKPLEVETEEIEIEETEDILH